MPSLSSGKKESKSYSMSFVFLIQIHVDNVLLLDLQANCAVCRADDSGATALSSAASCKDLFGTQCVGIYSKIRSWKSVSSCGLFCSLFYYLNMF